MIIGATIAVFLGIYAMAAIVSRPDMKLLYSGLGDAQAGDVLKALEQKGTAYEVKAGAIYVPSELRDQLRLELARDGLPRLSGQGYELLDNLSGFGTTSQMFDAAYLRAKEGELARTITANPNIQQARVHIASDVGQPFRRSVKKSASVTVVTGGMGISTDQAEALRFLVASAVAGLSPQDVAVMDSQAGLIGSSDPNSNKVDSQERSAALRHRVERLLEARVGKGNAVVEVSLETETATETLIEHRFDPESRVAISTDTEERSNSSEGSPGNVTVASNLPSGESANGGSKSQGTETRERVNYEVSETKREIQTTPGAIKRITVAVLVNGVQTTAEDGTVTNSARSDAELEALSALVSAAVGYNAERGDQITIKSMDFEGIAPPPASGPISLPLFSNLNPNTLIEIATLAVVTLLLGLFVVRPLLRGGQQDLVPEAPSLELPGILPTAGDSDGGDDIVMSVPDSFMMAPALGSPDSFEFAGDSESDRLKEIVDTRPGETIELLGHWISDRQEA